MTPRRERQRRRSALKMAESLDLTYARREHDRRAEQLRRIRANVNDWQERQETWDLVAEISSLVNEWPDDNVHGLLNVFWWFEIERLLFHAVEYRYEGRSSLQAEQFIDFVIKTGYRDRPHDDVNDVRRTTPIHDAAQHEYADDLVGKLFTIYDAFNVNYTNGQGFSHFHAACKLGCVDAVKRFLDHGQDPNCPAADGRVDPPLHLALVHRRGGVAELLLKNGADPQLANEAGLTPLHQICIKDDAFGLGELFFRTLEEMPGHEVQIDAQDVNGNTPLHMAATNGYRNLVRLLLRQGANPNTVNGRGTTALHMICLRKDDDDRLLGIFFEECDAMQLRVPNAITKVQIDARDKNGNTPLILAACHSTEEALRLLLLRGADPNLANKAGSTPLHAICQTKYDSNSLQLFFRINRERNQVIRVDARDESGWTPLQWALARQLPDVVEALLDNGADLSRFVFPPDLFDRSTVMMDNAKIQHKLVQASGVLGAVQSLVERGYEMSESDAQRIMKFFVKNDLFENPDRSWIDTEEFFLEAPKVYVGRLWLYNLIRFTSASKAYNLVRYTDYWKFAKGDWWNVSCRDEATIRRCTMHLCEKLSRTFLLTWTREPFARMTRRYALPERIREFILERLENKDLCIIALSAAGQNS
ncbi:ankyrin-1-like isoform X2 [Trichogramma pretiosum]|uniref:ankyrin-1-like isoform X1 n=1 Tax=Trichogramma pretiosum TaxID=7493 RepID=UPI000C71C811|nr:ankyrin-1-like isoform X1 [Trichogramma pretiosum]XP_023313600.1 ankyrin-1-like isoform X2 [Trichogramma pretiosum]